MVDLKQNPTALKQAYIALTLKITNLVDVANRKDRADPKAGVRFSKFRPLGEGREAKMNTYSLASTRLVRAMSEALVLRSDLQTAPQKSAALAESIRFYATLHERYLQYAREYPQNLENDAKSIELINLARSIGYSLQIEYLPSRHAELAKQIQWLNEGLRFVREEVVQLNGIPAPTYGVQLMDVLVPSYCLIGDALGERIPIQ